VREGVEALRAAGRAVELRGYLDKAEAEEAILRADYLLIPSRIESIPVVFSDAMKLGCPVIAMPVGDLPRLIEDHDCGIVAERSESDALAHALRTALSGNPTAFEHGIQQAAVRFSLQHVAAVTMGCHAVAPKQTSRPR